MLRRRNYERYAILNDNLARIREHDRRDYEEALYNERNGIRPEPEEGHPAYTAFELSLLKKATNPSVSDEERYAAGYSVMVSPRKWTQLDLFFDDLKEHLSVLRYSASVYYRSPVLAVLSVLMLLGHAAIAASVLIVMASATEGVSPFGSPFFDNLTVGWAIYNVIALTIFAFSPLFLSSIQVGIWKLFGGLSHKIIHILALTSAAPALLGGLVLSGGGSNPNPLVPVVFFAHAALPLIIRKLAAVSIRRQFIKLFEQVEDNFEAVNRNDDSVYLESLLKRKVIGTPGASLGASDFSESQVAAGVVGERKTAKVLDDFARSVPNTIVFHSVRWNMDGAPYDIDHVVVIGQRVFFLDSKNWSKGNYTMLPTGDTVLRDGAAIPNGNLHIQSGADTYINAYGIQNPITQVVVWTDGSLVNQNVTGPRLVTGDEMLAWLKQSSNSEMTSDEGYNVPLLRSLEAHTAS